MTTTTLIDEITEQMQHEINLAYYLDSYCFKHDVDFTGDDDCTKCVPDEDYHNQYSLQELAQL